VSYSFSLTGNKYLTKESVGAVTALTHASSAFRSSDEWRSKLTFVGIQLVFILTGLGNRNNRMQRTWRVRRIRDLRCASLTTHF
jgi:hypothetical protein